jgi:hypothetical protein
MLMNMWLYIQQIFSFLYHVKYLHPYFNMEIKRLEKRVPTIIRKQGLGYYKCQHKTFDTFVIPQNSYSLLFSPM